MGGADKPLLDIGGGSLLEHLLGRLLPQIEILAINANGDAARFDRFGCPVVADGLPGLPGPLAGILAGLDHFAMIGDTTHVLSVPGDTPFIPDDLAAQLADAVFDDGEPVAIAASGGRAHPAVGLWPVALREVLRRRLADTDDRSVIGFCRAVGYVEVDFPMAANGMDPFFNVNSPEDLIFARSHVAERSS